MAILLQNNLNPQPTKAMKLESEIYPQILKLVKSGVTIQNACAVVGVNRPNFYKSITKEQKNELRFYKATTLVHGTAGHFGKRDFMTLETEEEN
mgnify:CR=1 FL=1